MPTSTSPRTGTTRGDDSGAEQISDEEFGAVHRRPRTRAHAERIREIEKLGATVVCLQNASGAEPVRLCGCTASGVLPSLAERG